MPSMSREQTIARAIRELRIAGKDPDQTFCDAFAALLRDLSRSPRFEQSESTLAWLDDSITVSEAMQSLADDLVNRRCQS